MTIERRGPLSRSRRPTIKDVAEAAGVSRSTVSRALTGRGYAAPDVRERVLRAAAELGYVPDVMARTLKQQVSRSVGVLVSDLRNPFYAELAAGASREARERGYTMVLADTSLSAEAESEAAEALVALRVAGVVVTPNSSAVSTYLGSHGIPVVEVDRQFAAGSTDGVVVGNRVGARTATAHLVELGHRRIALFIDETDWTTGYERYQGYLEALSAADIKVDPDLVVSSGWDVADSRRRALDMLAGPDRPTAVFAANNVLAEGVWRAIGELGLRAPGEVSLVAFDDAPWMSMVSPQVSAVSQDTFNLGATAVRRLDERIEMPDADSVTTVLGVRLVARESTAPPPVL
ncbi:substrate-binding domain-containing protein [Nonomuraea phyllanthi]|uniref:Substrate-binding domain-containing protein n=1 Tax=Nonomuraea phyllanthi TaxID=2219224 RepID=A0A5C4V3F1_9ACTN|nr:LacI family DNA-binding transcriptional regulator [Nonomuraea phyllanthi]KAB8185757.1 substrate-binding domain-containing protein [Nonomuraea phyllanthi]QFY11174.1 substrate-binding domain-containing protein [Nonomuraea phyllanthi]